MSANINDQHVDFAPYDMDETAAKVEVLEAKFKKMELEKDVAVAVSTKAIADLSKVQAAVAVVGSKAPDSGKKVNYTVEHPDRHTAVVLFATLTLIELKKLANNQDAIWWVAKHGEALGSGDNPD